MAVRRQALQLAARSLEQRLNADTSDRSGAQRACPCGAPAQYRGRHRKTFESVLGPFHLDRATLTRARAPHAFEAPRRQSLPVNRDRLSTSPSGGRGPAGERSLRSCLCGCKRW